MCCEYAIEGTRYLRGGIERRRGGGGEMRHKSTISVQDTQAFPGKPPDTAAPRAPTRRRRRHPRAGNVLAHRPLFERHRYILKKFHKNARGSHFFLFLPGYLYLRQRRTGRSLPSVSQLISEKSNVIQLFFHENSQAFSGGYGRLDGEHSSMG